jgi:hypothetical protein
MQTLNIDVKKRDKTALYAGKKGTYLNLTIHDNKDGEDEWGNMGFVTQDLGKERRLAGERGPILGNWKNIGSAKPAAPAAPAPVEPAQGDDDEIPF